MKLRNLLISGRLRDEVAGILNKELPELNIKTLCEDEITTDNINNADIYSGFNPPEKLSLDNIEWIHSHGAGVNSFVFSKNFNKKILLTRTSGQLGEKIAEYCLSRVLYSYQNIEKYNTFQAAGNWKPLIPKDLYKSKVLIAGTGDIGTKIAKCFKVFTNEIYGYNFSGKADKVFKKIYTKGTLTEAVKNKDIVINCLPYTDETENVFNKSVFSKFKNAIFINAGRGQSVVTEDLISNVKSSAVSCAFLDVFKEEPLDKKSELWKTENIYVSPHVAALTFAEEAAESFIITYRELLEGKEPSLKVDTSKGY